MFGSPIPFTFAIDPLSCRSPKDRGALCFFRGRAGRCAMLTRRDLMKMGLVGTGYMLLPHDRPFAPITSSFADDNFQSPVTRPWAAPLPVPAAPRQVAPFADCFKVDSVTGARTYVCV